MEPTAAVRELTTPANMRSNLKASAVALGEFSVPTELTVVDEDERDFPPPWAEATISR